MTIPPGVVPVQFDDAVAARLATALDDLVDELTRLARASDLHARTAGRDWSGYSRQWFDQQLHHLLTDQRLALRLAGDDLEAVQRARAWAAAEHDRRVHEAALAAAAEEARLAELAETEPAAS